MVKKNDDWRLQTNVKNKPNAQGTLFSGGASQMPDAKRYKKGYNPERQRAVEGALGKSGTIGARVIDHTVAKRPGDDVKTTNSRRSSNNWTREVRETLKRSSVPAEDINSVFIQRMRPDHPFAGDQLRDALGVYQPVGGGAGDIRIRHDAHMPTVLHEIGHHASHRQETWHAPYNSPYARGAEEGFADRYMDDHAPDWNTSPFGKDRFAVAHRRGRTNYEPLPSQTLDSVTGARRPQHFETGYNEMRPHETRTPNANDTWRAANAEYEQKRADAILHSVNEPTLPGMDAESRLRRSGPWEGVKPS